MGTGRINEAKLRVLYRLYRQEGLSVEKIAAMFWQGLGYPSMDACRQSIRYSFRCRGWKLRSRSAAATMHHRPHSLTPGHGKVYGRRVERKKRRAASTP